MNFKIKSYFVCNIILFCFSELAPIENQKAEFSISIDSDLKNCDFGYFYIDSNEQGAGGGHSGILLNNYVYHYQRVYEQYFILDKTEVSSFLFNYSRIQNRNLNLICIDKSKPSEIDLLFKNFDMEFQKHYFYLEEILYWKELKENLRNQKVRIPTLPYYRFLESEFLEFLQENFSFDELIHNYEGEIQLYILEKFYKMNENNLFINKNYFIEIQNLEIKEFTQKRFKEDLKFIIIEWEKRNQEWLQSKRTDKYLSLLESNLYLEILKELYKNDQLYLPLLLVDNTKRAITTQAKILNISLFNKTQPVLRSIYVQMENELKKLAYLIHSKESLTHIQIVLQKIANISNQLILLLDKPNLILQQQIYILHTPQIPKTINISKILVKKREIETLVFILEEKENHYKNQIPEIFSYHLITENCVTKLFDFLSKNTDLIFLEEFKSSFKDIFQGKFIPWVSYQYFKKVLNKYKISFKEYRFYSFRNELLEELKKQNQNTTKELSTLSSKYYSFNPNDSFFIFFTENHFFIMPVFGIINFAGSIIYLIFDFIKQPYDFLIVKKEIFYSTAIELRGVFFSLTEIFFISVRKGTFLPYDLPWEIQKLYFSLPLKRKKI